MKKPMTTKAPAEQVVKDIRRATRKLHSSEEKIRIVLSGLRGEVATYRNSNRLLGHSIFLRSGNIWPPFEHADLIGCSALDVHDLLVFGLTALRFLVPTNSDCLFALNICRF